MVTKQEVIKYIDGYLKGKLSKKQVSQWAIQSLKRECFSTEEMLIEDAITALSLLHDEDERFDVAKKDLLFWKDCLSGKRPYGVKIEFMPKKERVPA